MNKQNKHDISALEDMFSSMPGESLHDEKEIKTLLLQGSKIGKSIIKKTDQLDTAKELLNSISLETNIIETKAKLSELYKLYNSGKALETKLGYIDKMNDQTKILGVCFNLVAGKIDDLENLKSSFDTEIQGY